MLNAVHRGNFAQLSDEEKCELVRSLGRISCAMAGSVSRLSVGVSRDALICHACDDEDHHVDSGSNLPSTDVEKLWKIFTHLLPRLSRTSSVRITTMTALGRTLTHASSCDQMQLASSVFGEFCLHSLRSSVRELRVVTGYDCFLHGWIRN